MRAKHPERADRLREFFNRLNIKNVTLASKLGIKPAFISQLLNKHSTVTTDVALRIGRVYPTLNIKWLLDGEGEMFLKKNLSVADMVSGVMEADQPGYEKGVRSSLRVEDLPDILLSLQAEVEELRRRMEEMERWRREMEGEKD